MFKILIKLALIIVFPVFMLFSYAHWQPDQVMNFRTSHSDPHEKKIKKDASRAMGINRTGLNELNISGSGLINIDQIHDYAKTLPQPLTVVSLMKGDQPFLSHKTLEYYGLTFVGRERIHEEHTESWSKWLRYRLRRLFAGIPQNDEDAWMRMAEPEPVKLKNIGIHYRQVIFPDGKPDIKPQEQWQLDWRWVDDFVEFMEQTPKGTPLHFHCRHGSGRTTVCMVMYDVFHNWRSVPLDDINDRQWALGGEDMLKYQWRPGGTWTKDMLLARKNLVIKFDAYMRDEKQGYGKNTFTQWLSLKGYPVVQHKG